MTDKVDGIQPGKEGQDVEKELSPEEANAQFEAGFKKAGRVQALGTPDPGTSAEARTDEALPGKAEGAAVVVPEADPQVKGLTKRMRKMEGSIGSVNSQLAEISRNLKLLATPAAVPGTAAGAQDQVQAQLKHLKEIEGVIGDFKEFKPFMDEMQAIRQDLNKLPKGATQAEVIAAAPDLGRIQSEITELVTLNVLHPDWQQTTATPEFMGFMLAKGPAETEYGTYCGLRDDPKTNAKALEMVEDWKVDHPQWYAEKGQYLFSSKAADSVRMLTQFGEVKKLQTQAVQHRQRQQNRLQRSVVPDGITESPAQGKTDEEAFSAGFKKARGQYQR